MSRTGMLQRRREVGAGLVMSGLNVLRLLKGGAHGMGLIFYRLFFRRDVTVCGRG